MAADLFLGTFQRTQCPTSIMKRNNPRFSVVVRNPAGKIELAHEGLTLSTALRYARSLREQHEANGWRSWCVEITAD
jgi:hypothetical protein